MTRLEDITRGCSIRGILPEGLATVLDVKWLGTVAIEVTYKDSAGRLGNELLYRDREPTLEVAEAGRPWSFDGDGALFRLLSEANRIRLAYLFDPLLAVHTSLVDPLAAPNHRRLRRDALPAAAPVPAGRRSRGRQDHHDRPVHQGVDRPRRLFSGA